MKCNSTICLAILYNKPTKTEDPGPILKMIIILVHQQVLTLVCGCQCAVAHDYLITLYNQVTLYTLSKRVSVLGEGANKKVENSIF